MTRYLLPVLGLFLFSVILTVSVVLPHEAKAGQLVSAESTMLIFPTGLFADTENSDFSRAPVFLKKRWKGGGEHEEIANSYRAARKVLMGRLHLKKNKGSYYIRDVYCHKIITERWGVGPNRIPDHRKVNTEHTWPKSRFRRGRGNYQTKLTDLHHLFPTDMVANSARSNKILAEVDGEYVHDCDESKVGYAKGTHIDAFEPPNEHKGNAARAIFYFAARYGLRINDTEEYYLRRWHEQDPVDDEERWRNDQIEVYQGNRNPFIDNANLLVNIENL